MASPGPMIDFAEFDVHNSGEGAQVADAESRNAGKCLVRWLIKRERDRDNQLISLVSPAGLEPANQTVMSGRIKRAIVDFTGFSFGIGRVCCVLARSFLVRNWCGSYAIETCRDRPLVGFNFRTFNYESAGQEFESFQARHCVKFAAECELPGSD
jgi:hypothetical protein